MKRFAFASCAALCVVSVAGGQSPAIDHPAYLDPGLPAAVRAHDLVSRMTLEEKASQLEDWAVAIPRLGVPSYQTWSEALHGVARAGYATVFPQAIGMAATWDPHVVHEMGDIISTEGRAKFNEAQRENNHRIFYGLTYWSPNINIFRDPRWGRGQETYGEDPFLTGTMGTAFIEGVQGPDPDHPKAVATSKHFAVHSGPESQRHTFDAVISNHDLEDTYLPAFRKTVVDGHVKSLMCAYNAIDHHAACANTMLLKDHLRDAWGFKGFVVSDCAAIMDVTNGHHDAPDITHAAAISLKAGTDLSCSIWAPGFNTLGKAVQQGLATEEEVTRAAERLFTARMQLGMFDPPGSSLLDHVPESEIASEAHRAVALKAAEESMVLLKNDGVLPLKPGVKRIAVVGPTADLLVSLEGNYNGEPVHPVTPLDGIKQQFAGATVRYAQGANLADGFEVPVPRTAFGNGLKAEFFPTPDLTGMPVAVRTEPTIQFDWANAAPVPEIKTSDYSVRFSGSFRAPAPGTYHLTVAPGDDFPYSPKDGYKLVLDGKVLGEGSLNGEGHPDMGNFKLGTGANATAPPVMSGVKPAKLDVTVNDTEPHSFVLEYTHSGDQAGGGVTLSWAAPADAQLAEAVEAAKDADVVVAFTGLSPQLEGEEMPVKIEGFAGGDRTSIDLPAAQQHLLDAMQALGKPVVVVNLSGSAVAMRWASQRAAAILQAWYPGVAGGTAVAETLAGQNNPAGRLPVTFYSGTQDLPQFTDYSMKNRTYRYYTGTPLWGFGYGLSYTSFAYGPLKVEREVKAGEPVVATVNVRNTGSMPGDEVVEAYVKTPAKDGPIHALAGFERVRLEPGESRDVTMTLDPRSISSVDEKGDRAVLAGHYRLMVGSAQPQQTSQKSEAEFTVRGTEALPK
jgi:beta-glucosidase